MNVVLVDKISEREPVRKARKRFLNDTIHTIGYQGRTVDDFIEILKSNKIEVVVDVRYSNKSEKKPEFNGAVLERTLKQHNIEYQHRPAQSWGFHI